MSLTTEPEHAPAAARGRARARRRGCAGRRSPSGRCRRPTPRAPCSTTGIAVRSTMPGQVHLRVQREAGLRGSGGPPAGPSDAESMPRRQPRPCCRAAASSIRPMPWPWRPGQDGVRREEPHQLARRSDVAKPSMPPSSSATQHPPGSVREQVPGARDPRRGPLRASAAPAPASPAGRWPRRPRGSSARSAARRPGRRRCASAGWWPARPARWRS